MLDWLKKLSVRSRGWLFAALLLLLLGGLGAFSLNRLGAFHALLSDVSEHWAPGLRELNDVGSNSERYRNLQNLTLLTKEPALKEGVLKRFTYVKNLRQAAWNKHIDTLETAKQKELAETVAAAWDNYMMLSETLEAFYLAGQDEQAISFSNNELQRSMDKYRAVFRAYLDYYIEGVQDAGERGDSLFAEMRLQIIALFIFAAPFCLLASFSLAALWV